MKLPKRGDSFFDLFKKLVFLRSQTFTEVCLDVESTLTVFSSKVSTLEMISSTN